MATIKSFTDLSQSKILSKILPLDSADMFWLVLGNTPRVHVLTEPLSNYSNWENYPCWSLAALLGVLTDCPDLSKHTDNKWYITTYPNGVHTCLMAFDNPVDACVAMIEKLNKLKML